MNIQSFSIDNGSLDPYNDPRGDVIIPDGVTTIEQDAFFCDDTIKSIAIPESVTKTGIRAFLECMELECVNFFGRVKMLDDQLFESKGRNSRSTFGCR